MKKRFKHLLAACLLVATGIAHAQPAVQQDNASVEGGNAIRVLLSPELETTLTAQMAGRISHLQAQLGARVEKGRTVVAFDCAEAAERLDMARAEHASRVVLISTHQAHDLESLMSHVLFVDGGRLALAADMMTLQRALSMGVTDDIGQLSDVIYQEHLGQQVAYVAANHSGQALPIHLELLYKALSLQKEGVLNALNNFADTASTKGGTP